MTSSKDKAGEYTGAWSTVSSKRAKSTEQFKKTAAAVDKIGLRQGKFLKV